MSVGGPWYHGSSLGIFHLTDEVVGEWYEATGSYACNHLIDGTGICPDQQVAGFWKNPINRDGIFIITDGKSTDYCGWLGSCTVS